MTVINTTLTDGVPVCIRQVRPDDEERIRAGIALLTPRSRYLRFFSGMREAPQRVIDLLVDVDGHDQIAWGALRSDCADTPALGVVHAFREADDPAVAQFSVAVIDAYHGRGLARLLTAVLLLDCRRHGLERLTVHVLAENAAALALVHRLGGDWQGQDGAVTEFDIEIADAIDALRKDDQVPGLAAVFAQMAAEPCAKLFASSMPSHGLMGGLGH